MSTAFKTGDHVRWNSEAGHVGGHIVTVHSKDFEWKGYPHPADALQYEITSRETDHVAVRYGSARHRV